MASPTKRKLTNAENSAFTAPVKGMLENAPSRDRAGISDATVSRRAMADVSPNVRVPSTTPLFMKRAREGSPLKRSFTAALQGHDDEGLGYLKRRRVGDISFPLRSMEEEEIGGNESNVEQPEVSTHLEFISRT